MSDVKDAGTRMAPPEREALVREADNQTKAILRLDWYKRIAYILFAAGVFAIYWGAAGGGPTWAVPVGAALAALFGLCSVVLYVGIKRAKKNVNAIMKAAGVDMRRKKERDRDKALQEGPDK